MNILDLPQGSEEWLKARAGFCTASKFKDVLAKVKVGEAAGRRNYRMQLVTERLTGLPQDSYRNTAMEYGTAMEPEACAAYEISTGEIVEHVGFIQGDTWIGASPDGLLGDDGGLEIKCPYQSTVHVETLQGGVVPSEHIAQIQGGMWISGRKWWEFVSFDPRMPEKLRLFVVRVKRDDAYIAKLAEEVKAFLAEVDRLEKQILRSSA